MEDLGSAAAAAPLEDGQAPCCDGIKVINAELAKHNATLNINLFGNPKVTLDTCKLRERERAKKPPLVFATFCPFCGARYPVLSATRAAA